MTSWIEHWESGEDGLGKQRADDVLAAVDDLGDLEVDDQAAEQVRVLGAQAVVPAEVVDHRPDGVLRGDVEVGVDAGGPVEAAGVDTRGERAWGGELRSGDREVLLEREA